ncbi:MAG: amidophosphoribosyltransferase, partial [Firmicutes bacterium]|nr:amidophosphoribosyltransferase [Bacillota bacterium]
YQDLDDLIEAVNNENVQLQRFETSVFNGHYVTGDVSQGYLDRLDAARNDTVKAEESRDETNLEVHNFDD